MVFKLSHAHVKKKKPRKQGLVKDQTHLVVLCWLLHCVNCFLCHDKLTKYKIKTSPCKAQLKQEKISTTYFVTLLIWEQVEGLNLLQDLHKVNSFTHSLLHKGVSSLLDVTILCNLLIHSVSNDKWQHWAVIWKGSGTSYLL